VGSGRRRLSDLAQGDSAAALVSTGSNARFFGDAAGTSTHLPLPAPLGATAG
jgi:hypothetical protein